MFFSVASFGERSGTGARRTDLACNKLALHSNTRLKIFTPLPGGGRNAAASDDDDRKVLSFPDESISADWKVESRSDGLRSAASGSSTALVVRPSSQLAPSCSATTSTGLVAACAPPEFNGHSSQWLNTEEMKKALGTAPGFMSRPAHLNALAFKCGDESCPSRQCTLLLDEINVYQLRNEWTLQMKEEGVYGEAAKAAVLHGAAVSQEEATLRRSAMFGPKPWPQGRGPQPSDGFVAVIPPAIGSTTCGQRFAATTMVQCRGHTTHDS